MYGEVKSARRSLSPRSSIQRARNAGNPAASGLIRALYLPAYGAAGQVEPFISAMEARGFKLTGRLSNIITLAR